MKILYYAVNGIGVGHLSRLIGIAEKISVLSSKAHNFFISEISDARFLKLYNQPFFHLPPVHSIKEDFQWNGIRKSALLAWEKAIIGAVNGFSPDLVVYDTLVPTEVVDAVRKLDSRPKEIFILREKNNLEEFLIDKRRIFDDINLVVFPHYRDEIGIPDLTDYIKKEAYFSGPIIRRDTYQIDLEAIGTKYNISKHQLNIVITNGGGNTICDDGFIPIIREVLYQLDNKLSNYTVFLFTGPLLLESLESFKLKNGKIIVQDYEPHLIDIMAASNLVICRGGYNTINECAALGVPTLSIPAFRRSESQKNRAIRYSYRYSNIKQIALNKDEIYNGVISKISQSSWRFRASSGQEFSINKTKLAQKILSLT